MITPEAAPEAVPYKIVVCGTCNVLFMVHPGRPSCPSCGGEPFLVLLEGEIPVSSDEGTSSAQPQGPAPAEASAEETPAAAAGEQGPDFDEVERLASEAAAIERLAAASSGLQ